MLAGVKKDDVLTEVDGKKNLLREVDLMGYALNQLKPGQPMKLTLMRGNDMVHAEVCGGEIDYALRSNRDPLGRVWIKLATNCSKRVLCRLESMIPDGLLLGEYPSLCISSLLISISYPPSSEVSVDSLSDASPSLGDSLLLGRAAGGSPSGGGRLATDLRVVVCREAENLDSLFQVCFPNQLHTVHRFDEPVDWPSAILQVDPCRYRYPPTFAGAPIR